MKPLAGGTEMTVAAAPGGAEIGAIAIDEANAYYVLGASTVNRAPLAGGGPSKVLATGQYVMGVAVDDTSVYWADNDAGTIMRLTPK